MKLAVMVLISAFIAASGPPSSSVRAVAASVGSEGRCAGTWGRVTIADPARPLVAESVAPQGGGDSVCPKKKSVVVSGGGSTSGVTTTCGDGSGCGYVFTYNPPRTTCEPSELEVCCVEQVQQGYTRTYSCKDHDDNPATPTICVGGPKVPFGSTHVVLVTVGCTATGCQDPAPEY
jgi:hypothetical protein